MANNDYLSPVETRLDDILATGRGVDGSLGADAQARAITAGTFRAAASNADLSDPGYPAEQFDRAYTLRFIGAKDDPAPNNPYQAPQFERVTLVVAVGYAYSVGTAGIIDAQGTETTAGAALRPDRRALSDGRRIKRALEFGDLRYATGDDPAMVECTRGDTSWQDIGGGRSLGVTVFSLVIQSTETTAYGP